MSGSAAEQTTEPRRFSGDYLERLFEGAGLALFACDPDGRVHSWNALGEQLFARRACSHGADLSQILPEADRETWRTALHELLETLEPLEFRTRVVNRAGDACEYAVWLAPLIDHEGVLESVSVWFHDITARLQVRRSMRQRERLTTLGTLSGAVAHHYNNLLCSVATSLEYALNMNTMSAMRRALRRTADAVSRGANLTQQLLAFAQADHRCCDMADLTETVLYYFDENEVKLAEQGIKTVVDWDREMPTVVVPRDQILVTLDNLVANAKEAMPAGGVLMVALRQSGDGAVSLSIADTGPGLPPDQVDRVFDPFFTTKGALGSGSTRQAGMGLAVVHGLISEMHGTITAANNGARGARFEITIPTTR
jgi:PAS domain S-box-containing protein